METVMLLLLTSMMVRDGGGGGMEGDGWGGWGWVAKP